MTMQELKICWRNFHGFYDKYMSSLGKQINATFRLKATRIDKVHFSSKLEFDLPVGNYSYIIIFSLVGVFMLLIASLNYMNMATARSTNRSKEVGLRKVIGAGKGTLIQTIHKRIYGPGNHSS